VSENRARRAICGPKREEVTGGWRKLLNKEHHNLYSAPNFIRTIKSRWTVFTDDEMGVGGRILLKWILNKQGVNGLDSSSSGYSLLGGVSLCKR
jgi:hypothetical protein